MRDIDLAALRARLAGSHGKTWWRGLEELADSDEFRDVLHREFPEQASEFDDPKGRRDFLKLMSASLALAGVTGCTRQPAEKLIPYVKAPEDIVPGRPLYFATAMPFGGAATPVLAESHMGRPTKIEPNPEHPATRGGSDVFAQAAILTLYDPDRSQTVKRNGEITPFTGFLTAVQGLMNAQKPLKGAGLRILSETVVSPSLADQRARLLAALPEAKWVQWEPVSRDEVRAGAVMAFGEALEAQYQFDKADVVLSLDADFLARGPGRLRWARDFMGRRRLVAGKTDMNRLYVVESTATLTGIKADHRLALKSADVEALARAVASRVGAGAAGSAPLPESVPEALVAALARDLQAHRGRGIVLAGEEQPAVVHALAHAMNDALGNAGETVTYTAMVDTAPAGQLDGLRGLAAEMAAGKVDVLVVLGANPVYSAPPDLEFAARMNQVTTRIHVGLFEDETAELCHWHIPETHFLEAWSDARAFDGTATICQPLIAPLYDACRSAHEIVAVLSSQPDLKGYDVVRDFWKRAFEGRATGAWGPMTKSDGSQFGGFEDFWRKAIHDGFVAGSAFAPKPVAVRVDALAGVVPRTGAAGIEITFRPCPNLWDGRFANNGWLMELPRPVTKVSWDNVALVSPRTAERLGVVGGYQVTDLVTLELNGRRVKMPIWTLPGQPDESIAVFLGYGRRKAGHVGTGVGADVNVLRTSGAAWASAGLKVTKNGERVQVPCTQGHFALEGRNHVRVATLGHYVEDPEFAHHLGHTPGPDMTLHGNEWSYESYAWGMSVDLNACVGCNACVVACQSENNIPVVGRDQVLKQREMHWIRIDRYYTGSVDAPDTFFQPMMCHHCETAPCEVVCPVAATVHSSEGLNDMVYNRCVGTRYCSNNCPYKVRRFNFFLYSDWNTPSLKMARNPDVTVRSRGVMEKCTYCVQRINHARIDAKREDRKIRDGDIVTACEAVCPTQAIVFGDINDPGARVTKAKKEPRDYGVLADLNTRPRTSYLAAVRNPNPELAPAAGPPAHGTAAEH